MAVGPFDSVLRLRAGRDAAPERARDAEAARRAGGRRLRRVVARRDRPAFEALRLVLTVLVGSTRSAPDDESAPESPAG